MRYSVRSRRAPYGARGLKLNPRKVVVMMVESRPVWGAWIEIGNGFTDAGNISRSRPVWGAWIEIKLETTSSAEY